MKRVIRHAMKKENRRGSALIISLTMITLLLFLAMIYAFEAQASQRQAKSAADSTQARFAANGALNNFLSLITVEMALKEKAANSTLNPAVSFAAGGFDDVTGRFILVSNNTTDSEDIDEFLTEPYIVINASNSVLVSAANLEDSARWIAQLDSVWYRGISNDINTGGAFDNRSLRKMGFMVIDYTGAMSPDYRQSITPVTNRIGASVSEIDCSASMDATITSRIQGLSDSPTSLSELLQSHADFMTNSDSMLMYNPVFERDPHEYWIDIDNDSVASDTELFNRIDITVLDSSLAGVATLYDSLLGVHAGNTNRDNPLYYSPWLKSLNITDPETAREVAAQLAVNICDHLDNDTDDGGATMNPVYADIAAADGVLTARRADPNSVALSAAIESRVFGNDNHLGLAAFTMKIDCTQSGDEIGIVLNADAKMVNCMDSANTQTGSVEFEVELTFTGTTAAGATSHTARFDGTIILGTGGSSDGAGEVKGTLAGAIVAPTTATSTGNMWDTANAATLYANWTLSNVKIIKLVVTDTSSGGTRLVRKFPIYHNKTVPVFFCQMAGSTAVTHPDVAPKTYYAGVIAHDPHFTDVDEMVHDYDRSWNFTDAWLKINNDLEPESTTPQATNITALYTLGTLAYNNGAGTPNATIGSTDTFYGKSDQPDTGGTFTRIGQLGKVPSPHTQKRSVRFWGHTNTSSGLTVAEENAMPQATLANRGQDAYLLDMFKVGSESSTQSTVNLNGSYLATFKALINGTHPAGVINPVNFARAILKANGITDSRTGSINPANAVSLNTYPMAHRGEIHRVFSRYVTDNAILAATYSTWQDDQMDTFIEEFIELTNVRQNYYMVYATGIATNNVDDVDESNNLAAHKIKAIIYRDAWKNTVKILRKDAVED